MIQSLYKAFIMVVSLVFNVKQEIILIPQNNCIYIVRMFNIFSVCV